MFSLFDTTASVLQPLTSQLFNGVKLWVKRDDLIDDLVSGNKWRKLKYHIQQFHRLGKEQIITFGGAYSNHLVATAKFCYLAKIPAIGIVRGEELTATSNPTLRQCNKFALQLQFVSRQEYQQRYQVQYIEQLQANYPQAYIVPEGGGGYWGALGCAEILAEVAPLEFDWVYLAAGTGTTAAGVLSTLPASSKLVVVSALKGGFMRQNILQIASTLLPAEQLARRQKQLVVYDEDLFGGYAKFNSSLVDFMSYCQQNLHLPLDQVYTAKAFYRLYQDIQQHQLKGRVLFLHTGGLQGKAAF